MLDGSRDLFQKPSSFLIWKINENNLCEYVDPWYLEKKSCVNIKIEKNTIQISDKPVYVIEKLTSDSLIVIEKKDDVTFPDKIKKRWFVRSSLILKNTTDKVGGDSIIITSRNAMPSLKRNINFEILQSYLEKKYTLDFEVDGNIRIFPVKRKVEVTTDNKSKSKTTQEAVDLFITTLEKDYKVWDLTGFEKFEKIIMPYHLMVKAENGSGSISFFCKVPSEKDERAVVRIKDKKVSIENFNKGLKATNGQKFDKAIEFFNEAHEYDNTNTDALYNIVSISIAQNKTDVACTALKKLKDLDQKEGIKLYNEKCSGK
ncbi:hypothetical protein [Chryseobacterium sediminis]|uniref:tetratricopeptide repeat protein n=1 Tax=Chryseobacterium sediminis TaxID=1679494 RepID=UPI002858D5FD|nr:hypothetical protein [Chryseobacterium sediminis]MDR6466056.1 hypothetical protein [Chryseobacterium sediminis]